MKRRNTSILLCLTLIVGVLAGCGKRAGEDGERACLGNVQACSTGDSTTQSGGSSDTVTTNEPTVGTGVLPVANSSTMVCVAKPQKTVVRHREIISVRVSVRGGTGPYFLSGYETYPFGNVATFWGSYDNFGSADIISDRAPVVYDNAGRQTTCPFRMTIRPATTTSAGLSCTLTASPASPAPNQPVTLTVTGSGATSYAFGYIQPQPGWSVTPTLLGNGVATASVQFANAGTRTATATIRNGTRSAVCNTTINVSTLGLVLASSAGPAANQLTVTALPSGFTGTPTFNFSVDKSGISQSQNGGTVTLTNNSGTSSLSFTLTATATEGTSTISKQLALSFSASPLSCTLQPVVASNNNGALRNDVRSYQVSTASGSASDGAITVTQIDTLPSGWTNPSGVANPFSLYFTAAQTATIRVKAQGQTQQCNGGAWITLTIPVTEPVSSVACSVYIQEGTARVGQQVHLVGSVGASGINYGVGPYRLEITSVSDARLSTTIVAGANSLTPTMTFNLIGAATFTNNALVGYQARVVDLGDGNRVSATCGNTYVLTPP